MPFNLVGAGFPTEGAAGEEAFFVVAMLLFPRAACDKMTGVCLAFMDKTGKGNPAETIAAVGLVALED
ncbi:MAG TPA: hypothetical protein VFB13_14820 [Reyranella sp.]|nr:hypothetical protein [Reyranella sp.]